MAYQPMNPRIMRTRPGLASPATRYAPGQGSAGFGAAQNAQPASRTGTGMPPLNRLQSGGPSFGGSTNSIGNTNTVDSNQGLSIERPRFNLQQPQSRAGGSQMIPGNDAPLHSSYDAGTGQRFEGQRAMRIGGEPPLSPTSGMRPMGHTGLSPVMTLQKPPPNPREAHLNSMRSDWQQAQQRASQQQQQQAPNPRDEMARRAEQQRQQRAQEQQQSQDQGAFGTSGGGLAAGEGQPQEQSAKDLQDAALQAAEEAKALEQRRQSLEDKGFTFSDERDPETGQIVTYVWGPNNGPLMGRLDDPNSWGPEVVNALGPSTTPERGNADLTDEQQGIWGVLEESGRYWVDPDDGEVYALGEDGNVDKNNKSTRVGNIYTGQFTDGRATQIVDTYRKNNAPQDDGRSIDDIIAEITGMEAPQMDPQALQDAINTAQARDAYETSKAMQAALASSSRARMGAGFQAGLTGDLAARGGLESSQKASQMRMQAEVQNFQSQIAHYQTQIDALRMQASLAASSEEASKAIEAATAMALMQHQLQKQLMETQWQMQNTITPGSVLGGLFSLGGSAIGGWAGGGFK